MKLLDLKKAARLTPLLIAMLFSSFSLWAQTISVRGVVIDEFGEQLPGVNVIIQGTQTGTVTDENGSYVIDVPASGSLVFSFIGYKTLTVPVDSRREINVELESDMLGLDEVVVIGYGTQQRRDITGSVASVRGDDIQALPVSNINEALTGKLAGVQILTTEGSPDAEVKIRVRGGGSITGYNTPLFIVDGFPVESISDIAPTDIESIDVLKDASSTAIYGSRGANGVIIVTTKRGAEGKVSVRYDAYTSFKKLANKLEVLSLYDYATWQYERSLLANQPNKYTDFFGNYQDIDLYRDLTGNDWQELTFGRIGTTFNHNLNISGGTEINRYSFSYSNITDKAIMQMSGFRRDNINLNLTNKPHKRVTLDFALRYSNTQIEGGGANEQNEVSSADSRLKDAMIYPSIPVSGLTDASETDQEFNLRNPLVSLADNDRFQKRITYNLNASITWEAIDNLRLRSDVGMDDYRYNNDRFYGLTTYYINNIPSGDNQGKPALILSKTARETYRNTNTVAYNFRNILSPNHSLNLLVGQEYILRQQERLTSTVHGINSGFNFQDARSLSANAVANSVDNFFSPDEILLSFFGRANYDFQSRYLFSATFRADGSSKFSEGNRWGYFPSAAFAWRLSDESFMEFTRRWFNDIKLRLSYGTAGNNNIPTGQLVQALQVSNTTWVNDFDSYWAATKTMANPDLKWETTVTRNIGLDFTALRGRLTGSLEGYINNTNDLLIRFPTPGTGYDYQYRNMGETQNRGIEAMVTWIAIDKPKYGLTISGNIGFNQNEIISLGLMDDFTATSGWASTEVGADFLIATGGSVGKMYGYINDGRYEVSDFESFDGTNWILKDGVVDSSPVVGTLRPGSLKLRNMTDEDNLVNADDRVIIGDANPLHTGGFTINARAFGFDFLAALNWSYGNDIYNANKIEYTSTSKYHSRNMLTIMESGERWNNLREDGTISNDPEELTAMNANTTMWSPFMSRFVFTDWAVEDGSFLRLNTLTLGYTIPKELLSRVSIDNLRVYVSGYNVFLWTNYSGFDPEVSTRRSTPLTPGVDYSAYPRSRSIVFGLNFSF
ncbi:SusC/RagA family TonB-linked outer membrane protein [Perlabentimonas gracilis]|uniref:SusC/RagA family TonB-linked outer membrane protein n=1 Tax=Perlabentimonas gracilis TaxID=2715279 RepID=UPI001C624D0E|nr:TonB-dependent receptor [Perlabentimonas gracilis]